MNFHIIIAELQGDTMRIKVAILDQDQNYQNRILVALRERFSKKLKVFPCANQEDILNCIETHDIKVFAINQMIDYDLDLIPEECAVVCLTELKTTEEVKNRPALCKYQKIGDICDKLYDIGVNYEETLRIKHEEERKAEEERIAREKKEEEERLERERKEEEERQREEEEKRLAEQKAEEERIAQEKAKEEEERKRLEEEQREREEKIAKRRSNPDIYAFISATSGEGSSTVSTACAFNNSTEDLKILYLDLKQFSNMERFFDPSETEITFPDVLSKAAKNELTAEDLQKSIVTDLSSGIDYINNTDSAYEIVMLGEDGINNLFDAIGKLVMYDVVIVNLESLLSPLNFQILNRAKKVVFVGSGTSDSNSRVEQTYNMIKKYDEVNTTEISTKLSIIYNKFIPKNCSPLNLDAVQVVGGANVYKEKTAKKVMLEMSKMLILKQLIEK